VGDGYFADTLLDPLVRTGRNSEKSVLLVWHIVNAVASCLFENIFVGDGYFAETLLDSLVRAGRDSPKSAFSKFSRVCSTAIAYSKKSRAAFLRMSTWFEDIWRIPCPIGSPWKRLSKFCSTAVACSKTKEK